ncbi:DHS-like NAD/FAD-binding domain-containing protein [Serendipita vermifera]|nr:DHS-like NAD/FAD-binding domain-containing protein [Serendipita vermifera]
MASQPLRGFRRTTGNRDRFIEGVQAYTALKSHVLGAPSVSLPEALQILESFLTAGPTTVLTGAGVSVDSGIRAYRGQDGRYMNPNFQPILYQELVAPSTAGQKFRQRYWARSYLGYPPVRDARPNMSHYALATLHRHGFVNTVITQNVDGLHGRAGLAKEALLELHGTLFIVRCRRGHEIGRDEFQVLLSEANPDWKSFVENLELKGEKLRTNPDGDIALEGRSYDDFVVPACPTCLNEGITERNLKPDVVFFGESVPEAKKNRSLSEIETAERLLVIGTTLATYSAYRLLQLAHTRGKPILLLNLGPTRADPLGLIKLEFPCGEVLDRAVKDLCKPVN